MPQVKSNATTPTQFRLKPDTLADLDAIASWLSAANGIAHTRTDAVRYAARQLAKKIEKSAK